MANIVLEKYIGDLSNYREVRVIVVNSLHFMKGLISPRRPRSSRRNHKVLNLIFTFVFFVV